VATGSLAQERQLIASALLGCSPPE
jgi:hypothetical protein